MPNAAVEPLPGALRRVAALQALMNGAHFAAMPMLAVLITARPGGDAAEAGTALAVYFVLSRIGSVPLAPIAERAGLWHAVAAGLWLRGLGFVALPVVDGRTGTLLACALLGLGQATHEAGIYGVMGRQARPWRDRLLVLNGQALNAGCVVGPGVGAALALWGAGVAFAAGGAALLLLGAWCMTERSELLRGRPPPSEGAGIGRVLRDRRFLLLCVALVPFWAVLAQLFAAFPLLAARFGGTPAWANSILFVNGLTGIAALALVGAWIARGRVLLVLYIGLGLAFATIAGTAIVPTLAGLLLIVALFSVGESFVMVASDVLTAQHADGHSTALYFGCLNASVGVGAALGGYAGSVASGAGSGTGLVVLGACGLLSIGPLALYASGRASAETSSA